MNSEVSKASLMIWKKLFLPDMTFMIRNGVINYGASACLCFRYMFSFIQKDKLCESLVEKLCHRYRATVWVLCTLTFMLPSPVSLNSDIHVA